ncbi:MAG: ATP-binding protein [Deltaproteobacteria bacterium]
MAISAPKRKKKRTHAGKLRIANHWNAISIIASSQANPLKAVAEFVENSIDAGAKHVVIVRGRKKGEFYLKVSDDGEGIPRDEQGLPDFRHVATHICDSIKRRLKSEGVQGIQGEFGIGLLSFWTVGQNLHITSCGADGNSYEMIMAKNSQKFTVSKRHVLIPFEGTELMIYPVLPGLRSLTGEKIQRYLASELRDRIKTSGANIRVVDRTGRAEYIVVPRQFSGRLLHNLRPAETALGDIYLELYLSDPAAVNQVGLYRRGTRVLPSITQLEHFQKEPWTAGYLQGILDAPFLNLTPGTRQGIIYDDRFNTFCEALEPVEEHLRQIIEEQRKADMVGPVREKNSRERDEPGAAPEFDASDDRHREFFEFAGPLFSVLISPKSSVVPVDGNKKYRALCRDRSRRAVWKDLAYRWEIIDGEGRLGSNDEESVVFSAPAEPCLTTLGLSVRQGEIECRGEALITVTDSLIDQTAASGGSHKGLPGYTYHRAPGEMWRSRFDADKNVIVINNGHTEEHLK